MDVPNTENLSRRAMVGGIAAGAAGMAFGGTPLGPVKPALGNRVWFDVTDYGAMGDGKTDDTTAIQAAINGAKNAQFPGGTVLFPNGCYVVTKPLNCDLTNGIVLHGMLAAKTGTAGNYPGATILYTSATGPVVAARGTTGFSMTGLFVDASSPAFKGTMIELDGILQNNQITTESTMALIENCRFGGESTYATGANPLISLNGATTCEIRNCAFESAQVAIRGIAPGYSSAYYSNTNHVNNCMFVSLGVAAIKNAGEGWLIQGNTFETSVTGGPAGYIHDFESNGVGVGAEALTFLGNWFGDSNNSVPGPWIDWCGRNLTLIGNQIGNSDGVWIRHIPYLPYDGSTQKGNFGLTVMGNHFHWSGTALNFGTGATAIQGNVMVAGNSFFDVNQVSAGTLPVGAIFQGVASY